MATTKRKSESEPMILNLGAWLPYRMFRIGSAVGDLMAEYYGPDFGLKRTEWRTIAVIALFPNSSVKEICEIGDMDQFTVSRAITQIVTLGYAVRKKSATDGRQASLVLLPAGQSVVEKITALASEIERELVAQLSAAEQDELTRVMRKLEDATAVLRARGVRSLISTNPGTKK